MALRLTFWLAMAFVAGVVLALVVGAWTMEVCIDRRDYAPGRNTYRLITECGTHAAYRQDAHLWAQ